jgi:hypothetical protein
MQAIARECSTMQTGDRIRRWLPWLLLAVALVATLGVYAPGLTGGWVFDDFPNIVDNAGIHITQGHATVVAWVNAALSSPASFLHRPLASITFAINWYFGGSNPWGYKFTNVLIHILNGILLYCMLRELLRLRACMRHAPALEDVAATRLALIVSAAWLLLPINLMAVLYVVQRMESLCQVFVLAGLWMYLAGRRRMLTAELPADDARGLSLTTAGIVLGTLLGLTSKETAVLLPVFAFLAEWIVIGFARRREDQRIPLDPPSQAKGEGFHPLPQEGGRTQRGGIPRHDRRIWTLFTVTLFVPAALGCAWLLRGILRPGALAGRDFTLVQRLLTEPRVLVDYLHWTLLPNPMVLSLYHDEIVISTGLLSPWTTLGAMVVLVALVVVAFCLRNRRPLVALGIGWFFAGNLLTATFIPLELVYEQRMYFASIGVLLAVAALLLGLRKSIPLALPRVFVVVVALLWFGTATCLRAQEWSNPLTLAVKEADRHPDSPRAVYEAGRLLLIASNYQPGPMLDASWKYLRQAAAIPGASTLAGQAMIMIVDHNHRGDDDAYWRAAIDKLRNQPTRQEDISGLVSLTNCYASSICQFDLSRLDEAYQAALSRPHPIARLDAAYAAFQRNLMHDDVLATKYFALAVAGAPSEANYRIDLAALYARQGKTERAVEQIDAIRRMNAFGRWDGQLATLERLAEQGKITP